MGAGRFLRTNNTAVTVHPLEPAESPTFISWKRCVCRYRACGSNKKYLSTDLVREERMMPGYLASGIEFVRYRPIGCLKSTIL